MAFAASVPLTVTAQSLSAGSSSRSPTSTPIQRTAPLRAARMCAGAPSGMPSALADRIFVRVDDAPEETSGGLVLPSAASDKPSQGVVVAVGPGRYSPAGTKEPMPVAVGDHVMWKDEFGVERVDVDGQQLLALRVPSVVCKW